MSRKSRDRGAYDNEASPRTPSLEARAEGVRRARRKKPGLNVATGTRLIVDESSLDRDNFEYRHVNDNNGRIKQLEDRDWDIAPEAGDEGATVKSTHAGMADGKPFNAVLMRKYKDWYKQDSEERQSAVNKTEKDIVAGKVDKNTAPELQEGTYIPGGRNTIQHPNS